MKNLIALCLVLALSGCASTIDRVKSWIPSGWDANQSARITDVRLRVDSIDCGSDQLAQARALVQDLRWFELYSESKGWRQRDVLALIKPMQETATDWLKRSQTAQGSEAYCRIKQRILAQQAARAAQVIQGRF